MLLCICIVLKLKNIINSRSPPKDIFLLLFWFSLTFFLLQLEHGDTHLWSMASDPQPAGRHLARNLGLAGALLSFLVLYRVRADSAWHSDLTQHFGTHLTEREHKNVFKIKCLILKCNFK